MPESRYQKSLRMLPEDWKLVRIDEVGSVFAGGTPSRVQPSFWDGDIPWVTPGEITKLNGKLLTETAERITQRGVAGSAAVILPPGTLLVTTRATIGAIAIAGVPVTTNQGFKNIVPGAASNSDFYFYLLQQVAPEMRRLASGSTFDEISKREFAPIRVPQPLLPEQCRIAEVLDTADEAIRHTEALIAKLKQMRQGLLNDLLTRGLDENGEMRDPVAHPEQFKDSPLGRIPGGWASGVLGEVVDPVRPIVYGILMPGYGVQGGVPVVKVKNIRNGVIDTSDLLLTSPAIDEQYRRSRIRKGDLLFTIRGTVGRMAFVPGSLENANITQDTARIAITRANPNFVRHYLVMPAPSLFIELHTLGQAVKGINLRDVRRIPVALPSSIEQDEISRLLDSHDARIRAEEAYLDKLQLLKKGLMQDLLTGRVRVPVPERKRELAEAGA
jgi:type I restriction enzyme S subunit